MVLVFVSVSRGLSDSHFVKPYADYRNKNVHKTIHTQKFTHTVNFVLLCCIMSLKPNVYGTALDRNNILAQT